MNVGILTFHWAYNYGSLLQAYCLCKVVRNLGHNVQIIDWAPPGNYVHWWQQWGVRYGRQLPARALRRVRSDRFKRRNLSFTKRCASVQDLVRVAGDQDAVIVGSDQLWNFHIVPAAGTAYFLDFVQSPRGRRISYAACFGDRQQPQNALTLAGPLLRRFDSLSVRDEMSAELVYELSGRSPSIVLDPTLLDDFSGLLRDRPFKQDYIAAYFISRDHISLGARIMRSMKERLGIPVIVIGDAHAVTAEHRSVLSAGPLEWLTLLRNAAFICTDSFHGTVAAIKFERPFLTWQGKRPDRLRSLLAASGLQERLISEYDASVIDRLTGIAIDYKKVKQRLEPRIRSSMRFLREALDCSAEWSGVSETDYSSLQTPLP
ncbi:MAG: polysaccharide pyruvyl transferase family protein [Acidobacteria bacterium]|nr:polysaccharide pyruvyl transferase family protein [Acidobacteriota bacterium]